MRSSAKGTKHKSGIDVESKLRNILFMFKCALRKILPPKDKPDLILNQNDAKYSNVSQNNVNEDSENDATYGITVPDIPEIILVESVSQDIPRLPTDVHENGHTLSASAESDQPRFVNVSTLTSVPSLSKENLHNSTYTTIGNCEENNFNENSTDSAWENGFNSQDLNNTVSSVQADHCVKLNISLDLSDFDEDDSEPFSRISTWNEEIKKETSLGCTKVLDETETDDKIISNIACDETRQYVNSNYNSRNEFDNQENFNDDDCRRETNDEGKLLETNLDSGLGDSILTQESVCSSATVFWCNESDETDAASLLLEDASVKYEYETPSDDGIHITTHEEEEIIIFPRNKYIHLWSYTNVTLGRNLNKSKCRLYGKKSLLSNDYSFGVEYDYDINVNKSNCNGCNPCLSAPRAKIVDIPLNEGSEKAVPTILLSWLNSSEIRFTSPMEYIVLPASLKAYFSRVTEGTLTREEMMAYEWIRFRSFCYFPPSTALSATRLANAGFYSTGSGTEARCFCCNVTYDRWSGRDDPHEVHRRISPNCSFLRGEVHCPQNIPIYQMDDRNISRVNRHSGHQIQYTPSMETTNPSCDRAPSASARDSAVENGQEPLQRSGPTQQNCKTTEKKENSNINHIAMAPNTDGTKRAGNNQNILNCPATPGHIEDNRITQKSRPECQGQPASTLEDAPLSIAQQPTEDRYNTDYSNPGNFTFRPPRDSREDNVPGDLSPSHARGPIRNTEYPKHSEYQMLEKRIHSFTGWPLHLDQTPHEMAEAGFFYVGVQDYVRCFQCGGGLRNFEAGDNPWIEHTRWYPQCAYVRGKKGQRFVDAVTKKQQELLEKQASQNVIDTSPSKSASLRQSVSSGSRVSRDSANLNIGSPGKQASLNENSNHNKAVVSGPSHQSRPVDRNVDARLSGPVSFAYPVPGNKLGHLNVRTMESSLQREAFNAPVVSSLPPFDPHSIREEHAKLKQSFVCKVCQEREAVVVFLPCGHLATCEQCAPAQAVCCVCQKKILASFKTYK